MADNKQRFKATVKVTSQTTYKPKKNDVKKEFDNPYRTSNYSSTKNYNKKDLVREAKKDALNKKYERTPNRNDIKEIKDNNINRPVNYNQTSMNSFLNKRKSPYRDSNNNEETINNSYPNEEVNDNKEDQTSNEPNENNNTETTRPSDLQPKDNLEEKEGKQSLKNRLANKAKNLIGNKGAKKAKENAKAVAKKKALSIIAKHPMALAIIGILFLILLIIVVVIGGGSITGSAYANSGYCVSKQFNISDIYDTYKNLWYSYTATFSQNWLYGSKKFYEEHETYIDENGFLRTNNDYIVALGTYFGEELGSRYLVTLEDGTTFTAILADVKSDAHTDSSHRYTVADSSIIEFHMGCGSYDPIDKGFNFTGSKQPGECATNEIGTTIYNTFSSNPVSIQLLGDDCDYNGTFTIRTKEPTTSDINKVKQLSPRFKYRAIYQCVWYVALRAVEIINEASNLTEEQKKSAIAAIDNTFADAWGWFPTIQDSLKNFAYDDTCTVPKAGSIITWQKGVATSCSGTPYGYCGHVGIIESVDNNKKTAVVTEGWKNNISGTFEWKSSEKSFDELNVNKCKGYTYLLEYNDGGN